MTVRRHCRVRLAAGIRIGGQLPCDMVAVRVNADVCAAVVGSPAYLAERPPPGSPRDLKRHLCIGYRQIATPVLYRWQFTQGRQSIEFAVDGPLTLDDPDLMVNAALDGLGLYVFEHRVTNHLAAGRLVRALEDCCPWFPGLFFYDSRRRHELPAMRALTDFIRLWGGAGGDLRLPK
jgi:DNA-binding transcriptional LysR family regulator